MRNANNTNFVYRNPRPTLEVHNAGGKQMGHCYTASYYEVTSLKSLSSEDIHHLKEMGMLGYGQGFASWQVIGTEKASIPAKLDWRTAKDVRPSGTDKVTCIMVDRYTDEVIPGVAINPYSGVPYEPTDAHYYVYRCESTCDSGD